MDLSILFWVFRIRLPFYYLGIVDFLFSFEYSTIMYTWMSLWAHMCIFLFSFEYSFWQTLFRKNLLILTFYSLLSIRQSIANLMVFGLCDLSILFWVFYSNLIKLPHIPRTTFYSLLSIHRSTGMGISLVELLSILFWVFGRFGGSSRACSVFFLFSFEYSCREGKTILHAYFSLSILFWVFKFLYFLNL